MNLDPKLVSTLLTAAVGYVALKLGLDLDADTQAAVAVLAGAVAGYLTPNDGTVLRTPQESGNPDIPVDKLEGPPSENVPPGGEDIVR